MRKNNVLKMMLCIVMLCVVSAFAASASAASSSESEQFLQLINMERAKAGVSAVTIGSQNLNDAAQARAQELTSRYSYVRSTASTTRRRLMMLAARAGMPEPQEDDKTGRLRSRILTMNKEAARFLPCLPQLHRGGSPAGPGLLAAARPGRQDYRPVWAGLCARRRTGPLSVSAGQGLQSAGAGCQRSVQTQCVGASTACSGSGS